MLVSKGESAVVIEEDGNYYLPGNWTDDEGEVAVGYPFEMEVVFPRFYITSKDGNSYKSDTTNSLDLTHRQL